MNINYGDALNAEQLRVVEQGDGPTLVLAGAGSGKTRTIIYRVAWLLEQGVDPSEILLVTFTNKAAREMTDRLQALLGRHPSELWAGTFHSIANRVLRQHAHALGFAPNYTILDQDDSKSLIKARVKAAKVPATNKRFPSPAVLQSILSYARNASLPIPDVLDRRWPGFAEWTGEIEGIAESYERIKRESNAMDFDDLLLHFHTLLAEHPAVERQLAHRFRYILVDEYQDTNALQATIVARLEAAHHNIFVVGDDAQSIYSFRAADIQNILRFPKMFPNTKTFRLEVNYRSTPEILALANESIAQNTAQFEKVLRTGNGSGAKPRLGSYASASQEALSVARGLMVQMRRGVDPRELAVLFRAAYQSQALEFELMKNGIPYEYRGGMRFFERAHIKDAIAFQRVVENPKDTAAWLRILGMQVGIGPAMAEKVVALVQGKMPQEWLSDEIEAGLPVRARSGWAQARGMLRCAIDHGSMAEQIRALLGTGYVDYLEHQFTNASDRLMDIEQLATFAETYTDRAKFLEDVSLTDEFGATMDQGARRFEPRPVLSTIHQAKGLEWDVVYIISLSDGAFPSRRAMDSDEDIQEERRLFYVAVTRARKSLSLSYAMTGMGEQAYGVMPSMFIQELSSGLLEREERAVIASPRFSRYDAVSQGDFVAWEPVIALEESDLPPRERRSSGYLGTY